MRACTSACGFCGRCTDSDGPVTVTRHCVSCGTEVRRHVDDQGPFWCDTCWRRATGTPEHKHWQEVTRG
jgi:hypothetical protein